MAKAKQKKLTKAAKIRKKKWYKINSPALFNNVLVGETLAYDANGLINKTLTVNLRNLTNNIKHQSMNLRLKITAVKDNVGQTQIIGFELLQTSIKRQIRRNSDRIDMSFVTKTKDGNLVRVKPLILTRNNTTAAIRTAIRAKAEEWLVSELEKITFEEAVKNAIFNKLQVGMKESLNKIFPVKRTAMRVLQIVQPDDVKAVKQISKKKPIAKPQEPAKDTEEQTAEDSAKEVKEAKKKKKEPEKEVAEVKPEEKKKAKKSSKKSELQSGEDELAAEE